MVRSFVLLVAMIGAVALT
jgi:ubiquinol-cytochrome c reductase cytochrome b subunit